LVTQSGDQNFEIAQFCDSKLVTKFSRSLGLAIKKLGDKMFLVIETNLTKKSHH
jgi:hypothetical protein